VNARFGRARIGVTPHGDLAFRLGRGGEVRETRCAGIGADSDVAGVPDVDGGVLGSLSLAVAGLPTVRFRAH
jgi:hypothetical protein